MPTSTLIMPTTVPARRAPSANEPLYSSNTIKNSSVCWTEDVAYNNQEIVPVAGPCERCICNAPEIVCSAIKCDLKPGCKIVQKQNQCCPDYKCECEYNGEIYNNGEKIDTSDTPCRVCYCKGGEIMCTTVGCYAREDCEGKIVPGTCCPKYDHCPPSDPTNKNTRVQQTVTDAIARRNGKRDLRTWQGTAADSNAHSASAAINGGTDSDGENTPLPEEGRPTTVSKRVAAPKDSTAVSKLIVPRSISESATTVADTRTTKAANYTDADAATEVESFAGTVTTPPFSKESVNSNQETPICVRRSPPPSNDHVVAAASSAGETSTQNAAAAAVTSAVRGNGTPSSEHTFADVEKSTIDIVQQLLEMKTTIEEAVTTTESAGKGADRSTENSSAANISEPFEITGFTVRATVVLSENGTGDGNPSAAGGDGGDGDEEARVTPVEKNRSQPPRGGGDSTSTVESAERSNEFASATSTSTSSSPGGYASAATTVEASNETSANSASAVSGTDVIESAKANGGTTDSSSSNVSATDDLVESAAAAASVVVVQATKNTNPSSSWQDLGTVSTYVGVADFDASGSSEDSSAASAEDVSTENGADTSSEEISKTGSSSTTRTIASSTATSAETKLDSSRTSASGTDTLSPANLKEEGISNYTSSANETRSRNTNLTDTNTRVGNCSGPAAESDRTPDTAAIAVVRPTAGTDLSQSGHSTEDGTSKDDDDIEQENASEPTEDVSRIVESDAEANVKNVSDLTLSHLTDFGPNTTTESTTNWTFASGTVTNNTTSSADAATSNSATLVSGANKSSGDTTTYDRNQTSSSTESAMEPNMSRTNSNSDNSLPESKTSRNEEDPDEPSTAVNFEANTRPFFELTPDAAGNVSGAHHFSKIESTTSEIATPAASEYVFHHLRNGSETSQLNCSTDSEFVPFETNNGSLTSSKMEFNHTTPPPSLASNFDSNSSNASANTTNSVFVPSSNNDNTPIVYSGSTETNSALYSSSIPANDSSTTESSISRPTPTETPSDESNMTEIFSLKFVAHPVKLINTVNSVYMSPGLGFRQQTASTAKTNTHTPTISAVRDTNGSQFSNVVRGETTLPQDTNTGTPDPKSIDNPFRNISLTNYKILLDSLIDGKVKPITKVPNVTVIPLSWLKGSAADSLSFGIDATTTEYTWKSDSVDADSSGGAGGARASEKINNTTNASTTAANEVMKNDSMKNESRQEPAAQSKVYDPLMPYPEEYPEEYQTIQNGPAIIITRTTYTRIPDVTYTTVTMATLPTYQQVQKAEEGFADTLFDRKFHERSFPNDANAKGASAADDTTATSSNQNESISSYFNIDVKKIADDDGGGRMKNEVPKNEKFVSERKLLSTQRRKENQKTKTNNSRRNGGPIKESVPVLDEEDMKIVQNFMNKNLRPG